MSDSSGSVAVSNPLAVAAAATTVELVAVAGGASAPAATPSAAAAFATAAPVVTAPAVAAAVTASAPAAPAAASASAAPTIVLSPLASPAAKVAVGVKGAVKAAGAGGAAPAPAAGAAKAVAAAPKVVGEPKTYAEAMSSMGGLGVSGFTGVLGLSRAWMITACVAESLAFASGVCAIGVSWTAITYPVGYSQFAYTPQTVYFGPLVMNVCGVQTSVLADTCLQSFYFSLYATLGLPEPITINMTYTAGVLAFAAACIALGCVLQLAAAVATGHAAKAILASTAMGVSKRCRGVGTALSAANLSLAGFSSSMLGCLICWGQFAPSTVLMTGTATPLPGFPNTRNAYYGEYLAGLMILSSSLAAGLAVAYKCRLRKEAKVAQPKGVVKAVLVDFLGAPAEQNCFC